MNIEAIAIGTGPSVMPWIKAGEFPKVPLYGCSWIPWHIKLNAYALGDTGHLPDVPRDGTRIVSTKCARRNEAWESYDDGEFPHASQSGGMAISMACREYKCVGLIGFDGGLPDQHEADLRKLLEWWKIRGRTFVSLMPKSTFDDLLETPCAP